MKQMQNKMLLLLAVQLILLCFFLPGCFAPEEYITSFYGEDIGEQAYAVGDATRFVSDTLELEPGVYQIRARAKVGENNYIYLELEAPGAGYGAVRSNPVVIRPGQTDIDYEIYVLEKIKGAGIVCEFHGEPVEALMELSLYRLNWGSRMMICVLLAVFALIDFLLIFHRKIRDGSINKEQQVVFWVLLGCVVIAYVPYLTDYFSLGADGGFQITRIEGLTQALKQGGQFPVRVQSFWLSDHGYAVSTFYGDFFLMIPVLLRLIGFTIMTAYQAYVLLAMVATAVIAYFSFYKCVGHRYAALMGSAFYVLAPYRIYDFYNRNAMGEYTAMIFLPLLCCGMYLMFTGDVKAREYRKNKLYLILGLTGILQCHVLSSEIAAGIILMVCIVLWKKTFRKETFIQLAQAAVITLLLNCWFWVPLLYMMAQDGYYLNELISTEIQAGGTQLAGVLQLFPNMGGHQTGIHDCEPIQIGVASLLMLALYFAVLIYRRIFLKKKERKDNPYGGICRFLVTMVVVVLAVSTRYFPWDMLGGVPVLGFFTASIQFPTRMLAPASALAAMLAAFFPLWLHREAEALQMSPSREKNKLYVNACLLFLGVLAAGSAVYHVDSIVFRVPPVRLYNIENLGSECVVNGEYLLEGTDISEYHFHGPVAEDGLEWSNYHKNGVNISMELANTTDKVRYLELPLTGYKGYGLETAEAAGEDSPEITGERGAHGDLRIAVPAGYQGSISISYVGFPIYRVAEAISILTILILLCVTVGRRLSLRHGGEAEDFVAAEDRQGEEEEET